MRSEEVNVNCDYDNDHDPDKNATNECVFFYIAKTLLIPSNIHILINNRFE